MAAQDQKTLDILTRIEGALEAIDGVWNGEIDTDEEARIAVDLAHELNGCIKQLEARRTEKNARVRKTMNANTAIFKPFIDRADGLKKKIRATLLEYMVPGGRLGQNMDAEEVRIHGEEAQAFLAETTSYEITDLEAFVKAHPELMKPDMTAIAKRFQKGEAVEGVTPVDDYQLRIV